MLLTRLKNNYIVAYVLKTSKINNIKRQTIFYQRTP